MNGSLDQLWISKLATDVDTSLPISSKRYSGRQRLYQKETGTSLSRQKNEHPVTIVRDAKDFVASLPPEYAGR